jgi:hypothetical protein
MKKIALTVILVIAGTVALSSRLLAGGIPQIDTLAYHGVLESEDGAAITGEHELAIELWSAIEAGERACASEAQRMNTLAGRFSIALPEECSAAVRANPDLWVAVIVDGTALPRAKIGAVPYSVEADNATRAGLAAVAQRADSAGGALEQRIATLESRLAAAESAQAKGVRGEWVASAPVDLPPEAPVGSQAHAVAQCPAGKRPIGGGCDTQHGAYAIWVSTPVGDTWDCRASPTRTTGTTVYGPLRAWAFCADLP